MKFKVGDVIELTEFGLKSSVHTSTRCLKNVGKAKILDIEKDCEWDYMMVLEKISHICFFDEGEIQKVEEKEMKLEVTTDYKGPKYCMVRDNEDEEWVKAILINDNSDLNLEFPYNVIYKEYEEAFLNGKNGYTEYYRCAKPCPEKEYKAYSEPKLEWIGKIVKGKSNGMLERIRYISDSGVVFSGDGGSETPFDYLYKNYTWLDGSPCGEEVLAL